MLDFVKRLLSFGGDRAFYETKGFWSLIITLVYAAASYFGQVDLTDPASQAAAAEHARNILLAGTTLSSVFRIITAVVKPTARGS